MSNDALSHRIAIAKRFGERIACCDAVFQTGADGIHGMPCTVVEGKERPLSGVNAFMLIQVMKDYGWNDPRFYNARQIVEAGWKLTPDASGIGLQFLSSVGEDGMPLENPSVKRFKVFHASEIDGVPARERSTSPEVIDVEDALEKAGSWSSVDGLSNGILNVLWDSQVSELASCKLNSADAILRSKLALCLLEVQLGLEHDEYDNLYSGRDLEWVSVIEREPLAFFAAVRDAERLAAEFMQIVRLSEQERLAIIAVAQPESKESETVAIQEGKKDERIIMPGKGRVSAYIEALWQDRQAVLVVPYADKDKAHKLGAVWYEPQKIWFVPKELDVNAFNEWNPHHNSLGVAATRDVLIESFRKSMDLLGLDTSGNIEVDGRWHNVAVNSKMSKRNNKAGSYIISLDGAMDGGAIGTILNKDTGEHHTWRYDGPLLTPEQRARLRAEVLEREANNERQALLLQESAAVHASEIWAAGTSADQHGYVVKKGIPSDGLRQVPGTVLKQYPEFMGAGGKSIIRSRNNYLIVPMKNVDGELRAVQAISEDGSVKTFMRGAQKKGTMMVIGAESFHALNHPDISDVAYTEGIATGASFHACSGVPVVVCFDAGNLETVVAQSTNKLDAATQRILAIDNDQFYVERAVGYIAAKLGMNPHHDGGTKVHVANGDRGFRLASFGEIKADGEWHQESKGSYCVTLTPDNDSVAIKSVKVELVPINERKISAIFENRGLKAGLAALAAIEAGGGIGKIAMPSFKSLDGRPTDWNDLEQSEGVEAVRAIVSDVVALHHFDDSLDFTHHKIDSGHSVSVGR